MQKPDHPLPQSSISPPPLLLLRQLENICSSKSFTVINQPAISMLKVVCNLQIRLQSRSRLHQGHPDLPHGPPPPVRPDPLRPAWPCQHLGNLMLRLPLLLQLLPRQLLLTRRPLRHLLRPPLCGNRVSDKVQRPPRSSSDSPTQRNNRASTSFGGRSRFLSPPISPALCKATVDYLRC